MIDPEPETATRVVQQMAIAASGGGGDSKLTVETTSGKPVPSQEAPRSDTPAAAADPATAEVKSTVADPNELKPNVEADPNALPPLQQSNQLDSNGGSSSARVSSAPAKTEEMADISSSKKKKKKGLAKLNPF
jgi:outer membrane protein assembly factor BamD